MSTPAPTSRHRPPVASISTPRRPASANNWQWRFERAQPPAGLLHNQGRKVLGHAPLYYPSMGWINTSNPPGPSSTTLITLQKSRRRFPWST
jgi:hypothetical protein